MCINFFTSFCAKKNMSKTLCHVASGQLIVKCVELASPLASVFLNWRSENRALSDFVINTKRLEWFVRAGRVAVGVKCSTL